MDLQINSKSHVPVHVQLEEQIKHLILTGSFEAGDRLPSIRALAGFLRVNRNTVARVISDLEREGFVESRRGSGVYVVEPQVNEEESGAASWVDITPQRLPGTERFRRYGTDDA